MDYLENLDPLLRTFWYIAIPTSLIFVIQMLMTFIGGGGDGMDMDWDADFDGDSTDMGHGEVGFQIFSFRNLINFLLGFSWTGISFYDSIPNHGLLILVSLLVGLLFVYLYFVIIRQLMKLSEDNSFSMQDTIGLTGEVYLPIPPRREGKGKVMVSVRGAIHELDAVTDSDRLEAATIVRVVDLESPVLLLVEPI